MSRTLPSVGVRRADSIPHWDVIVVGAGPAGSVSAGLLAERGHRVLLLERAHHPRPKPCGEFINPGAWAALRRIGFDTEVTPSQPAPLVGWDLTTWQGHRVRADFGAAGDGNPLHGWGLARMRFDEALARGAVRRGATLEEGRTVVAVARERDGVVVQSRRGEEAHRDRARLVVAADGLRSRTLRHLGVRADTGSRSRVSLTAHVAGVALPPGRGWLRLGGKRTVGLAPLDPHGRLWNVTVVADPTDAAAAIRHDRWAFLAGLVRDAGVPLSGELERVAGPWGSGAFEQRVAAQTGPHWAAVGDAAGYFDPLTGQGVHQAVRSAELMAAHADVALRGGDPSRGLPGYQRELRRELAAVRRVQRLVARVVEHHALNRVVFPRLGLSPASASALVRVTGDWESARSLLRPGVWLPLVVRGWSRERGHERRGPGPVDRSDAPRTREES